MRKIPSPVKLLDDQFDDSQADSDIRALVERHSGVARRRNARKIAFGWYGGKFSHLEWLLPLLPECHH